MTGRSTVDADEEADPNSCNGRGRFLSDESDWPADKDDRTFPSFLRLKTEMNFSGASPIQALRSPSSGE